METTSKRKFPAPLSVDWPSVKRDYIAGTSAKDLALHYNISPELVRQRAKRGRWTGTKPTLSRAVTEAVTAAVTATLRDRQEEWKARELRSAGLVVDHIDAWVEGEQGLAPKDIASLSSSLQTASVVGRRALDMENEQSFGAFSAGLCVGAKIGRHSEREAQLIDVSTNPPAGSQA